MSPPLIGGRFEIESLAGAGGMGVVYRAVDRHTGVPVAVKMMARLDATNAERFEKEAHILAELDHPRIVRYVAHGNTGGGQYLAMEWLEGETLADRLLRGPLAIDEAVALLEAVARTVAVVHARGVVHRDIKPSNLFLVGGALGGVKILDFGIARGPVPTASRSEALVGTPGYVAPEQAQGARGVDARADVFALGAVLFECLTGRPTFVAGNVMALLAKILLEEAPRATELRPEVPAVLDALVARMLAKDPALRPRDAGEVAEELAAVKRESAGAPSRPLEPTAITEGEQRVLSVILATRTMPGDGWDEPVRRDEDWGGTRDIDHFDAQEAAPAPAPRPDAEPDRGDDTRREPLRKAAEALGGSYEELADGSMVVTLKGGAATDQAVRAARCALALRRLLPDAPMALATGRGMVALRFPVGEAIDAAARLLREVLDQSPIRGIRIDDTTAGLLDSRFEIGGERGLELLGEREVEGGRTLLGKRSPFVGRERELAFLTGLFDECAAEPMARPVVVTAPAGAGKSRLVQELRARLAQRSPAPEVWVARGDPSAAGSPFGLLAPALRRVAGILDGEPIAVQRQKLRARLMRHVAPEELSRISHFIGELVGIGFDDEDSLQLRAARRDPLLMGEQMRRAFEDWVAAETGAPLVIVLEDLHWGDLPTVRFIDAALRHVAERPLLVLAVARPEVHKLFPQLWAERGLQELRLGELTRRPAERLVREVLGRDADDATVVRLVERAAGNALYLEELIRAVAEGRQQTPATVLAMVAARLEALEPEARRLLRAASIFGQVFPRGGVAALVGGETSDVDAWLDVLTGREIILRRQERRFPGEHEHSFRHGLIRDAAYALLTDADRALGHRLAAEWLLRAGETDATVLAAHLQAGGAGERAVGLILRAAAKALEGDDFAGAVALAEKGLALAPAAEAGELRLVLAEALNWRGEFAAAEEAAAAALADLPRAAASWFRAVGQLAVACARRGNVDRLVTVAAELAEQCERGPLEPDARDALLQSAARVANQLLLGGRRDLGAPLLDTVDRAAASAPTGDPAVAATLLAARAPEALYRGEPEECYRLALAAAARYRDAGSLRLAAVQQANAAFACIEGGAYAEAETVLRELLPVADRLGIPNIVASTQHNLGLVRIQLGALDEGIALERDAIAILRRQGDRRLEGSARVYLASALEQAGDLEAAAAEAEAAVELLAFAPPLRAAALAGLAHVRLLQGQAPAARALAEQAVATLRELGSLEEGESLVRLVNVLTLEAVGRAADARAALAEACAAVLGRAEKLRGAWRDSFLAARDNARTLALARERSL